MYFFILGRKATLSIVEIFSVLKRNGVNFEILAVSAEILILKTDKDLSIGELMSELGGSVKIGKIIKKAGRIDEKLLFELIYNSLDKTNQKVYFGFSRYSLGFQDKLDFKRLGLEIKKELKNKGLSSRLVVSRDKNLSSVVVKKNKLLSERGMELVLMADQGGYWVGQTLAVQDFEDYSYRDYQRPARDMISGIMPPKLAKIMINLAGLDKDKIILDPFCGCGTILQEAALLGYENLIGTDISEGAVKSSQENVKWLGQNFKSQNPNIKQISNSKIQIFKTDIRDLSQKIDENSINAIITEPYLGPTKNRGDLNQLVQELSDLYLAAFQEFKKVLQPAGRVVMIWPIFNNLQLTTYNRQQKLLFLEILDQVKKLGFRMVNLLPDGFKDNLIIKTTKRGSIIYSRPDQQVLREIFVFENKN